MIKSEGSDGSWEGNGIAELNYTFLRGFFTAAIEKRLDVENFSGTDQRGLVDYWDFRLTYNYDITRNLTLNAGLILSL